MKHCMTFNSLDILPQKLLVSASRITCLGNLCILLHYINSYVHTTHRPRNRSKKKHQNYSSLPYK